ncbi:MAG: hypothetical protein ACKOKF_04685, partial [Bacteroidota bacterium]
MKVFTNCDSLFSDPDTLTVNTSPVITTTPAPAAVSNTLGQCRATVTYSPAAASGISTPTITYSQASGTTFPVGTTPVTVTATNTCGMVTSSFNVRVNDTQVPTITAPPAVTFSANSNCQGSGNLGTPTAADNCTTVTVTNNAPATFPKGTTTVIWTATDGNNNTATATQTVTVVDNTNPTIIAPPAVTFSANSNCQGSGNLGTPTAADNCTTVTVTNNAPTTFPLGTTTVTWTATDGNSNSVTATQSVTVVDNTNPTITAPANVTFYANSNCIGSGSLGTPTTADNCSIQSVTNS